MVILEGDSAKLLKDFNDNCIDLTVTSPPYDNLRTYGGYTFDFEAIAKQLYRVTKDGGVVVWIIGDETIDWSETGSSFTQALYFKKIGFNIHDTMIYAKNRFSAQQDNTMRYNQIFEYVFILSREKPVTFNPIKDVENKLSIHNHTQNWRNKKTGKTVHGKTTTTNNMFRTRPNIWYYNTGGADTSDTIAYNHPAIFPEKLAGDHIKSWSNEGDLILDPFAGSGTTLKAAHQLNRKWIGIEINPDYVQLAKKRLMPYIEQQRLEQFIT